MGPLLDEQQMAAREECAHPQDTLASASSAPSRPPPDRSPSNCTAEVSSSTQMAPQASSSASSGGGQQDGVVQSASTAAGNRDKLAYLFLPPRDREVPESDAVDMPAVGSGDAVPAVSRSATSDASMASACSMASCISTEVAKPKAEADPWAKGGDPWSTAARPLCTATAEATPATNTKVPADHDEAATVVGNMGRGEEGGSPEISPGQDLRGVNSVATLAYVV